MKLDEAVLSTLAYFDIFDYPLTKEEVLGWLPIKSSEGHVEETLHKLFAQKRIGQKGVFYFLPKRSSTVDLRQSRERISRKKLKIAHRYARLLGRIPTVCFVGLTGALAMNNSHTADDIDFLIITSPGAVWFTRFWVTAILSLLGKRRGRGGGNVADKICLNMFFDFGYLKVSPHNLYTAHEILQMKSLWDSGSVVDKFLAGNDWVWRYLPNQRRKLATDIERPRIKIPAKVESMFFSLQLLYMRRHRTREKISRHQIAFHPRDTQSLVLKEYQRRLAELK